MNAEFLREVNNWLFWNEVLGVFLILAVCVGLLLLLLIKQKLDQMTTLQIRQMELTKDQAELVERVVSQPEIIGYLRKQEHKRAKIDAYRFP